MFPMWTLLLLLPLPALLPGPLLPGPAMLPTACLSHRPSPLTSPRFVHSAALARSESPCARTVLVPGLLLPRPLYPPLSVAGNRSASVRGQVAEGVGASVLLLRQCSCEDVDALQQRQVYAEHELRALSRRITRLENMLKDVVDAFLTADDVALMERSTCAVVVYNEQLTKTCPPRLVRDALKKLKTQYAM